MAQNKLPTVRYVQLDSWPILEQLRLEEALLRADEQNWCIVNKGASPAIVMGISGVPSRNIDLHMLKNKPVPVIKRFSGGGTVFVDQDTFFVTFIFNRHSLDVEAFPEHVFNWTGQLYRAVFDGIPFQAFENDYIIDNKKFGGNAQYFRKNRWLHHTSFLWDYQQSNMDYLLHPTKMPTYRQNRKHEDFVCRLKDFFESQAKIEQKLIAELSKKVLLKETTIDIAAEILEKPHRKATECIF